MKIATIAILASVLLFSCVQFDGKRIKGNGNIITQNKDFSDFDQVDLTGSFDVILTQGAFAPVKIEGDENIISHIKISQEGSKLILSQEKGYRFKPSKTTKIYLTAPEYTSIDISGAGDIKSTNQLTSKSNLNISTSGAGNIEVDVDAPSFSCDVSGAGSIQAKGNIKDGKISISGAGNAHCYDLLAENLDIQISGVGSADVFASKKLNAELSGAGSISYKGTAEITKNISGMGSIKKADE